MGLWKQSTVEMIYGQLVFKVRGKKKEKGVENCLTVATMRSIIVVLQIKKMVISIITHVHVTKFEICYSMNTTSGTI